MQLSLKIAFVIMSTFLLLGNQHMYAQAQIGNGKPAPGGDVIDATSGANTANSDPYGNFEVGLPGNTDFKKDQPVSGALYSGTPIRDLINTAVTFALAILVIIGVITIVIGGYMYMTAAGNASQVQSAKEMIMSALLGIFIAFISVVLLNTINPFLGKNAVEPSLGPVGSGAPGGGTSSSGSDTAAEIADLQSQEQAITNEISALESQIPPGGTASAQLQEQINQDEARLQDLIDRVRALEKNP